MKIHTRNLKGGSQKKRKTNSGRGNLISVLLPLVIIFVTVFAAVNFRISLNQKTDNLNKNITKVKRDMRRLKREVINLKIQQEKLSSWEHIKERIIHFALALRQPDYGQVRELVISPVKGKMKYKLDAEGNKVVVSSM